MGDYGGGGGVGLNKESLVGPFNYCSWRTRASAGVSVVPLTAVLIYTTKHLACNT